MKLLANTAKPTEIHQPNDEEDPRVRQRPTPDPLPLRCYAPEIQFLRQERDDGNLAPEWVADLDRLESAHRQHHGECPISTRRNKGLRGTFPNGRRATIIDFGDYLPIQGVRILYMDLQPATVPNEPPTIPWDTEALDAKIRADINAWEHSAERPISEEANDESERRA